MPRSYRQISQYEKEIIELYNQGMTLRAIAEKLGFTHKQVQEFKTRYNKYRIQTKTKLTPLEKRNQFVA
ncbi:helix-turn-helix transcriptional regulator [Eubacterium coprostanoligenes]|uniref:helix-turn-helix transcriptional regulator n=1 Tax=Eubacterium coprostanoligenes TaxID=290054 RepID=UPI0023548370|nr:helix-turn-helix domain-containing protein [Eubacterium coprostanoligenes]MCI6354368.1 helix-turn-helix domain-containing protein [Eubacterium coprostanoligenes]MDY4699053.1 helix-turn-helix domain-containing protein [Eubacterium coprostanoligenes]